MTKRSILLPSLCVFLPALFFSGPSCLYAEPVFQPFQTSAAFAATGNATSTNFHVKAHGTKTEADYPSRNIRSITLYREEDASEPLALDTKIANSGNIISDNHGNPGAFMFPEALFRKRGENVFAAMVKIPSSTLRLFAASDAALLASTDFESHPKSESQAALEELAGKHLSESLLINRVFDLISRAREISAESIDLQNIYPVITFKTNPMNRHPEKTRIVPTAVCFLDKKSKKILPGASSFITINDEPLSIDNYESLKINQTVSEKTLDIIISFQLAQMIFLETYGRDFNRIWKSESSIDALPWGISDRKKAFREGFSMAILAVCGYARQNWHLISRVKDRAFAHIRSRDNYILRRIYHQTGNSENRRCKNASQMLATSGISACVLLDILTSPSIENSFNKLIVTLKNTKPYDLLSFVKGFEKCNPKDRNELYKIFLENTSFVTVSEEAWRCTDRIIQSRENLFSRKTFLKDLNSEEADFNRLKISLMKKALKSGRLADNIGPQLWFSAYSYKTAKKYFFDLNSVDEVQLSDCGVFSEVEISMLLNKRHESGYFEGDPSEKIKEILKLKTQSKS
ncbi:MAG: hypothetical protein HQM10_18420 [Candidatus Riflebacteria bacterium]|nr:hypothetical protein [Candidatus Riflebacteria bacterium]